MGAQGPVAANLSVSVACDSSPILVLTSRPSASKNSVMGSALCLNVAPAVRASSSRTFSRLRLRARIHALTLVGDSPWFRNTKFTLG